MSRLTSIHKPVSATLGLTTLAAVWWGCGATPDPQATTTSSAETSSASSTGQGGASTSSSSAGGAGGGGGVDFDGGPTIDDSGACTSTSAAAEHVQLDLIFLIDRSGSMAGEKWMGTTKALTTFFNDPKSANIGAGMSFFPNHKASICVPVDYETLDVPINVLPGNAFPLSNAIPAAPTAYGTPTWGALKGLLMAATAYQDAHPTHKVAVVIATDGDPNACGNATITDIANLAKSARNYNGVLTYVIGVEGSIIPNLDKIAVAGGTTAAYDITTDINDFSAKMEDIRSSALGCEFGIPPPPNGQKLDPDKVNFSYTPKGLGMPKVLLRADDLADCNNQPGWYYDSNLTPSKVVLCPASCNTVQADAKAKVEVLFGCKTQIN
jgi:Mg-chelatase subunit ChlD